MAKITYFIVLNQQRPKNIQHFQNKFKFINNTHENKQKQARNQQQCF